ncbi:MAG: YfhO family protein [Lachnospiraceae bacterium]|nr:YfhO family protein [Lachnospiraceae bacterium]
MKKSLKVLKYKKWIWGFLAFMIPFIVSVLICASLGIYPFGENCILHVDMYHQYCPFFIEFREKLTEGGSLLYSWNLGLGSDFVSLFAYYLASPLNWLLILCPEGLVIEFMTLTIWIKIALSGLFFFWYLKGHFHLIGKDGNYHIRTVAPAIVFSTAYAFSGYVAAYSWNIMWMDSIALAPLIILGLERLVKENKPILYYVTLSVSILSNFYISLIICIFLVLYFGILLLEYRPKESNLKKKTTEKLQGKLQKEELENKETNLVLKEEGVSDSKNVWYSMIERFKICIRFAWYSLLAGGTGAILLIPEAIILGYSASADSGFPETMEWYFVILEELSRLCTTATPYTGNDHWPNLYCGAFTVLLVVLYAFNTRVKPIKKIPRLLFLALFIVSFSNNYLDMIWHGLRFPNSLPGRQSFLFIFLMLVMGYETYLKRKGNKVWHIGVACFLCGGVFAASSYVMDKEITDTFAFSITAIFLASYMLILLLLKIAKKEMRQMVYGFAFALTMGEIILNMAVTGFYSLSRTSYLAKMDDYHELLELAETDAQFEAENKELVFYRVEDTERKTKNDDSLYGYPSATIFSSLMNIDVSRFYQSVYMEGGKNYYCYNGATPLVSSMLSVKYMLSDNDDGENRLRSIVANSGNYYLYQNKYCLPLGFMMSEEAIETWDNSSTLSSNKIPQINLLAYALGAESDLLTKVELSGNIEAGRTELFIEENGFYYGNYLSCSADNLTIKVGNDASTRYGKTTHRYLFEFGECKAGESVVITNSKDEAVEFTVYKMDFDALNKAYQTLRQQTMQLEEFTDTFIKGTIDVEEAGSLIFSIPCEEGWTLCVDGKEVEAKAFKDTFISVYLEEGVHSIELSYMTPGLAIGTMISGSCIVLFIVSMLVKYKIGKKIEVVA